MPQVEGAEAGRVVHRRNDGDETILERDDKAEAAVMLAGTTGTTGTTGSAGSTILTCEVTHQEFSMLALAAVWLTTKTMDS